MASRHHRCAALVALLAAGCAADDPIRTYEVDPPAEYKAAPPPAPDYRVLGAMFPADDPVWFFKFAGKAGRVAEHEAAFDRMLATVRLAPDAGGKPVLPHFVPPADWARTGPRVVRRSGMALPVAETLRFGPADDPLEVTVTQSSGGAAENVGRWADQVGYRYAKADDLQKVTRPVRGDGVDGLRVDVAGPNNPAVARGPMAGGMGR